MLKSTWQALALRVAAGLVVSVAVHAQDAAPDAAASASDAAITAPMPSGASMSRKGRLAQLAVTLEPVQLAPDAKVDPEMEADCKFEDALGVDVGKMLHKYHLGGSKVKDADGRVLRISIVEVTGKSGGAWTGSKSMRIHAVLLVDGKQERQVDMYRYNNGANPFRGTCHVFRQHTKRLGKDLASWIKDASFKVDNPMLNDNDNDDADAATAMDPGASAAAH